MKRELRFLDIEGAYGGDQHWLRERRQIRGGCSTVCACEVSIVLANRFPELQGLYRPDTMRLARGDFIEYAEEVFRYIYPHEHGLDTLELFVESYEDFARTRHTRVSLRTMSGEEPVEKAEAFLKAAIDAGYPLAYLLLHHTDARFEEYNWHWFTATGYEQTEQGLDLIFATWGKRHTLPFRELWDTGFEKKGGMVLVR